jgi:integrase
VFPNRTKTLWLGDYSKRVLLPDGTERRKQQRVVLGLTKDLTKRQAQRLLQPHVDEENRRLGTPYREQKQTTLEKFTETWKRDYLVLVKPSTQASIRGHLKRLNQQLGQKTMRDTGAADLQQLVTHLIEAGLSAKTIKNHWITTRLIWRAAVQQGYADQIPPKPALPRVFRHRVLVLNLAEVARTIAKQEGWKRLLCRCAAETGLRYGELEGLHVDDVTDDRIHVRRTMWNCRPGTPKTPSAVRTIAVSAKLGADLRERAEQRKKEGKGYLFSTYLGRFRAAELKMGFHRFRHFNASLMDSLNVPLKTRQERLGHASTGSLTIDVYTHASWASNVQAAQLLGEAIDRAVNLVELTTTEVAEERQVA